MLGVIKYSFMYYSFHMLVAAVHIIIYNFYNELRILPGSFLKIT